MSTPLDRLVDSVANAFPECVTRDPEKWKSACKSRITNFQEDITTLHTTMQNADENTPALLPTGQLALNLHADLNLLENGIIPKKNEQTYMKVLKEVFKYVTNDRTCKETAHKFTIFNTLHVCNIYILNSNAGDASCRLQIHDTTLLNNPEEPAMFQWFIKKMKDRIWSLDQKEYARTKQISASIRNKLTYTIRTRYHGSSCNEMIRIMDEYNTEQSPGTIYPYLAYVMSLNTDLRSSLISLQSELWVSSVGNTSTLFSIKPTGDEPAHAVVDTADFANHESPATIEQCYAMLNQSTNDITLFSGSVFHLIQHMAGFNKRLLAHDDMSVMEQFQFSSDLFHKIADNQGWARFANGVASLILPGETIAQDGVTDSQTEFTFKTKGPEYEDWFLIKIHIGDVKEEEGSFTLDVQLLDEDDDGAGSDDDGSPGSDAARTERQPSRVNTISQTGDAFGTFAPFKRVMDGHERTHGAIRDGLAEGLPIQSMMTTLVRCLDFMELH